MKMSANKLRNVLKLIPEFQGKYAMLDDGSTLSFVNHQVVLQLNLPMERTYYNVLGHDGTSLNPIYWKTDLVIQNKDETLSTPIYVQSACVASGEPMRLPLKSFEVADVKN